MRLEPRCCRTSIWYTIFVVVVVVVLVDIQKMELVLTNIFTLCWQYIPRDLVNLVVSHLAQKETCPHLRATRRFLEGLGIGRAAPYKKGVLTYQFFMFWKDPPRSYKKGVRSYHRYFFTSSKGKVHRPWSFCRELLLVGNRLL